MKLDKTLNFKKVRCVKGYDDCLEIGKEYEVIDISVEIKVKDDEGNFLYWEFDHFEPVLDSAENPLQGVELTPEFEAVEPKFKVGDKVYFPRLSNKLCVIGEGQEDDYVDEINGSKALAEMHSDLDFVYSQRIKSWVWNEIDAACPLIHATPENHALLSKLYPHIKFEAPPKPLTGIELAKKLIAKGHNYLVVDTVIGIRVLTRLEGNTLIDSNNVRLDELDDITPLDDITGEPLTESILND